MTTITDMEDWLFEVAPKNPDEVYSLYKAVQDEAKKGIFDCKAFAGKHEWLIKCGRAQNTLLLASNKAKGLFLSLIHCFYADPEIDMDDWYRYSQAAVI